MSFEEAEMHAKLKESMSDPKCADRTDKILKALAQLQEKTTPKSKPIITSADHYHLFTDTETLFIIWQKQEEFN